MTIESDLLAILDLAVENELLRVQPEPKCERCTEDEKCWAHRLIHEQRVRA